MYVCVTYDISSTKKRNKVVTLLESYGFRVQKSVFEIELTEPQFNVLKKQLSKILAYHSPITKIADEEDAGEDLGNPEDEDSIKFYILSKVGEWSLDNRIDGLWAGYVKLYFPDVLIL